MAGKIPQHFIDDLLDRVDIVDVISSRVQLKKTGKNYSACCPFHDEKTPSFTVSPEKQFYYCFGCQASGNAVGFVMDFDRFSFPEAVEQLARDMGMEVPREETTPLEDERARYKKRLYNTLNEADEYFQQQLRKHPASGNAVDYLKGRGLTGQITRIFGIGYAPPGWDNLLNTLGTDSESVRLQVDTGLLIEKPEENKRYDRFRNRIMFPIRDTRGRTIAFGGRVLGDDKPKYLNSPETPVFHKGRELYGLYEATQSGSELKQVVVVEGYMDVVALAQHGIDNAVATLGTAITAPHLEKLFRYTPEVVFCFDGDNAGRQAAHRALENCLPMMEDGRSAKFLFLPEGEDPDSLVRKSGTERFRDRLAEATPLSKFLFDTAGEGIDTDTPDGKARLVKLATPYIQRIPRNVFRSLLTNQLAKLTGMDGDKLDNLIGDKVEPAPTKTEQPQHRDQHQQHAAADATPAPEWTEQPPEHHSTQPHGPSEPPRHSLPPRKPAKRPPLAQPERRIQMSPERTLVAILLNNLGFAQQIEIPPGFNTLDSKEMQLFEELITLLKEEPTLCINQIIARKFAVNDTENGRMLAAIAASETMHPPGETERDNWREFHDALRIIERQAFANLSIPEQIATLIHKEQIDEHDVKTAMRILPLALRSDLDTETKAKLNQIIRRRR